MATIIAQNLAIDMSVTDSLIGFIYRTSDIIGGSTDVLSNERSRNYSTSSLDGETFYNYYVRHVSVLQDSETQQADTLLEFNVISTDNTSNFIAIDLRDDPTVYSASDLALAQTGVAPGYMFDGNDSFTGSTGNDYIQAGTGLDSIESGDGDDTVFGGTQGDTIVGGAGNDELRAGKGKDSVDGGDGNDTIYSGLGEDTLTGGSGADVFVVRGADANFPNALLDFTITDFVSGADDIAVQGVTEAQISEALAGQTIVSGNLTLSIAGATITLVGVNSIDSSDIGLL